MTTRSSSLVTQTGRAVQITWTGLTNGDDGAPASFIDFADRSVQVFGTFGAGGTLRIEGSNDGINWAPLTDPQGNTLDFTSAKIEQLQECVLFVRPKVTAGDGTTSLTAIAIARKVI